MTAPPCYGCRFTAAARQIQSGTDDLRGNKIAAHAISTARNTGFGVTAIKERAMPRVCRDDHPLCPMVDATYQIDNFSFGRFLGRYELGSHGRTAFGRKWAPVQGGIAGYGQPVFTTAHMVDCWL